MKTLRGPVDSACWRSPARRSGRALWHEGLDPDVPATLPEGVAPLSPPEIEAVAPDAIDDVDDVVLLRGLRELGIEPGRP